ncbi:MAG: hypothetical protein KIH69_015555 [Anaerolineae bacterium]|nr:hypothetical protein [Anaerolineae bacterium]
MGELGSLVSQWSRRARWQTSLRWLCLGLAIGLGLALIPAVTARYMPLLSVWQLTQIAVSTTVLGGLIALAWPWLRHLRRSSLLWARHFDQRFGLKERVSTAMEIESGVLNVKNDHIRKRQVVDAAKIAEGVDFKRLLPLRLPWKDALLMLALAIGLVVALVMPNPQQEILAEKIKLQEELAKQVQQLEDIKNNIKESKFLTDLQKEQALQALDQAQDQLRDSNASEESAMAALNEAQDKLDALQDEIAKQQARELERAGQSLSPDDLTKQLAESLSNRDFEKAAEQLRQLTNNQGQELTQEQQRRLADQMEQLAKSVQNSDPNLAQNLRDSAQAMREGRNNDARQALDKAAQSLDRAGQNQASQRDLNQASNALNEARRQAARNQNQGQSGSEQGGEQGQGEQGMGEGNVEAGEGEAMQGEGQGQGGQPSGAAAGEGSSSSSQHSEDTGSSNSVYAPQRLNEKGESIQLPESRGVNSPNPSGRPNQAPTGNSSVPYQQVYSQYAKAADEALQNGDVPADMREYVREYFSSLNPRQSK